MHDTQAIQELSWKQTSPTTFERSIDHCERFYQFIHVVGQGRPDKQNWHVTAAVKIDTERDDFVSDVRQAWIQLRFEYPILSAYIDGDHWLYRTVDEDELSSWISETFYVHDTTQTARQLFPFETNPSRRAVLHVIPSTQEIVLQGPHTHLDGIGAAAFFQRMMQVLVEPTPSTPKWGLEGQNLLSALSISAELPPHTEIQRQKWDTNLHNWISQFPTVRVHNENKGAAAMRTTNSWLIYDEEETKSILSAAKQHAISLTAAVQAAVSLAARAHGQVDNTTHATLGIFDARGYIDASKFPHNKLVSPHVFALPAVFPLTTDSLVETARSAREVFQYLKKDNFVRDISPVWVREIPGVLAAYPPEAPVAADLQLSSIGVLDKYLPAFYSDEDTKRRKSIEVVDLWISLEILSPSVIAEVWTFRNKLNIELIWNEAYHNAKSIKSLLHLVHEQISQGLGLTLKFEPQTA